MKNSNTSTHAAALDALESRIAYRIAARLSQRTDTLDGDVAERLRFAREQALERAKAARAAQSRPVVAVSAGGAAVLGRGGWWLKLGSALPILALAAGLFLIQHLHTQAQIEAAAQIDVELLADDLPPEAYNDAGFVEFLKNPQD
ncbi:MAG: DUF3619 family protein [Piscinibacter sp.]|uniref:DUF3619 family protein n=1 Tax=Piscinibacter sp. TaxID=1903157 RepID=UPI001B6E683D|nr:DUF3619 family protein [Piscinibacter sp.]MBP5990360.1 DUF3619 family protein [Piscinibacter sp.]MBP6028961.1 DUF3619 family protein [Piscinibacter sp.]